MQNGQYRNTPFPSPRPKFSMDGKQRVTQNQHTTHQLKYRVLQDSLPGVRETTTETTIFCVMKLGNYPPLAVFCRFLLRHLIEDSDWLLDVHSCKLEVHRCFLLFYAVSCSFVLFCVVSKRRVKNCNKKLRKTASDQQKAAKKPALYSRRQQITAVNSNSQ